MSALTRCLQEEASAIATAAERLSSDQVEAALALLERCADRKAKLVITGVGKSGIVARKIAATFSSIGLSRFSMKNAPTESCEHQKKGLQNAFGARIQMKSRFYRPHAADCILETAGLSRFSMKNAPAESCERQKKIFNRNSVRGFN